MTDSWFRAGLLNDRTALVTGGGTGICRGIALALARAGCDVAIASRKKEHLEPTAEELAALGVRALAVSGDVRVPSEVDAIVRRTVDAFGRLDILVNGAAGNFIARAENLSPNGFGTVIDIDLKGTFNVSRAAFPHLRVNGGVVLNISATLQLLGTVGQVHASAAKAGVDALTRTLAAEWGPAGIRVNGLAPGPVDETEGVRRLTTGCDEASDRRRMSARPHGHDRRGRRCGSVSVLRCIGVHHGRHAGHRRRAVAAIGTSVGQRTR